MMYFQTQISQSKFRGNTRGSYEGVRSMIVGFLKSKTPPYTADRVLGNSGARATPGRLEALRTGTVLMT